MPIQLSGSLVITGSITTTGVITMSGSIASASYSSNSDLLQGTGSVGFTTTASFNAVSSSQQQISASQQQISASFLILTASFNAVSASQQQISSSQQQISASLLNVIAVYATTGSNSFRATQSITGSLTVTGQIVAQSINVQQVTSSIIYSSGSNVFGCDLNSRQTFTGSVLITGSLTIAGASSATSYSGTTIYGSTAVCSAVGKFSNCIDAGSGTFSNSNLKIGYLAASGNSGIEGGIASTASLACVPNSLTLSNYNASSTGHIKIELSDFDKSSAYITYSPTLTATTNLLGLYVGSIGTGLQINSSGSATFSSNITLSSRSVAPSYGSTSVGINLGYLNLQNVVANQASYANNVFFDGTNWKSVTSSIAYAQAVRLQNGYIDFHNASVNTSGQTMTNWDSTDIKMRITSGGNVGIGTDTPNFKTHISTGTTTSITQPTAGTYGLYVQQNTSGNIGGIYIQDGASNSGNSIYVGDNNGAARFVINTDGIVGIGTSSPCALLHVNGTSRFISCALGSHIFGNPNVCNDGTVIIGTVVNGTALSLTDGAAAHTYFKFNVACGSVIESDSKLTFITAGSISSLTLAGSTGIACFGYTVCAPCFATISDYRMKSNIRPIEGLSIIMNTKPYKFEYNYDCSTSFGMIAHELQDTLPEAVFGQKDGEVMQGVDYMKLLPITIKAIQEQQCTICSQASMINTLKTCLGIN